MKEKVLITGASGFLGYHLIHAALAEGLDVYAGVRKTSKTDHLKDLPITFVSLNLSDTESLTKEITEKRYNYIIHAAGVTKARSMEDYNRVNAGFTVNLATAAIRSDTTLKKFIFISSLAAAGPLGEVHTFISEKMPPHPVTDYGRSKLLAEHELNKLPLPVTILRPTAIYGPREADIFIIFKSVKRGLEPYIGKVKQQLSFIFVREMAQVTIKALYCREDGTFNISDGNTYGRYDLAEILKELMHKKTIRVHVPMGIARLLAWTNEKLAVLLYRSTIFNRDKLNELVAANWACDIAKAKTELDFRPVIGLKEGLTETLKWYREHKWL